MFRCPSQRRPLLLSRQQIIPHVHDIWPRRRHCYSGRTFGVLASMDTTNAPAVHDRRHHVSTQSAVLGPREFFFNGVV